MSHHIGGSRIRACFDVLQCRNSDLSPQIAPTIEHLDVVRAFERAGIGDVAVAHGAVELIDGIIAVIAELLFGADHEFS